MTQVACLCELLSGKSPLDATKKALTYITAPEVIATINEAVRHSANHEKYYNTRNVDGKNKGWVLNALYCGFYALNMRNTGYNTRIEWVIRKGGDTDTNGAIAGALLGAHVGYKELCYEHPTDDNIKTILSCDTETGELARPYKYSPKRLMELSQKFIN